MIDLSDKQKVTDALKVTRDVHRYAGYLNRCLREAHDMGLRIKLDHEPQGEDMRLPNYGSGPLIVPGEPPSVSVEVTLRLPAEENPDA